MPALVQYTVPDSAYDVLHSALESEPDAQVRDPGFDQWSNAGQTLVKGRRLSSASPTTTCVSRARPNTMVKRRSNAGQTLG